LIVEGDTSSDTNPLGSYNSVDLAALDNMEKVVYDSYMNYQSNETFDLGGKVHKFTQGVSFSSNITFTGEGTIWVSGGSGHDYGLELCSNVYGPGGGYADVNLIVSGGTWSKADIMINSNVKINGLISGSTEVDANSNVAIQGVIESGGTISVNSNVTIQWGEFGFEVPITGASATTIVRSWQEL